MKWYDVLTFKVIESDPDWGTLQIKVDAKINAKVGTTKIEIIGDQQLLFQRTAEDTFLENFDLGTLTARYVYTLRITTSVGVYIGEFEM